MSWIAGETGYTWHTGSGKFRKDLIRCSYPGPDGRRYMLRVNRMKSGFNIVVGRIYSWGRWDERPDSDVTDLIGDRSEDEWNRCWDRYYVPEITNEDLGNQPASDVGRNPLPPQKTWLTSLLENIDLKVVGGIVLLIAGVTTAIVLYRRRKKK